MEIIGKMPRVRWLFFCHEVLDEVLLILQGSFKLEFKEECLPQLLCESVQ